MGCTSSKLDDLPAVSLCRERCNFLEAAIQQRYLLSESHVAYSHSLKSLGHSLHLFINHHHHFISSGGANSNNSPTLNLPPHLKGDKEPNSPKKPKLAHSGSDSGHLEFDSDSDSDDDLDSLHHHHSPQQQHHLGNFQIPGPGPGFRPGPGFGINSGPPGFGINSGQPGFIPGPMMGGYMEEEVGYNNINTRYPNPDMMMGQFQYPPPGGGGGSYMHMNYMKKQTMPPSVIYEHRPSNSQRVYVGESSSSSYYEPGYGPGPVVEKKQPPPPPSPPRSTAWDFLNPFDVYYPPYTPSRDSRELREEEGIPDLEYDDSSSHYQKVVKEVHGKPKKVAEDEEEEEESPLSSLLSSPETVDKAGVASTSGGGDAMYNQSRPSLSVEKEGVEYEVHEVEKKVVEDEIRRSNANNGPPRGVPDVAKEIEVQFLKAAESGNEIAMLLEVGKHPYGRKHHAASKMLHGVTSSLPSAAAAAPPTYADIEEELASRSRNLSSTLHKLHLWEKKLYHEVKAEEKLRIAHEKKLRKLKKLDERGAEANKVDTTRRLVRDMSTKIRIAIQVVDKISVTINKIRDEDLWPQLNALIQGLTRMWKTMLECHQSQCQAIREAQGLGPIRASRKLGDEHLEATSMLGHELINWILGFSSWISAQKGYVKELNKWLMKCLLYEPEETADGIVPFSPGRMGAPPIFVICNQWSQALDRISEKEVIEAMRSFTTSVLQLWEQDRLETTMMGHGDSDKRVNREEQRIHREIQALEKKMVHVAPSDGNSLSLSGNIVYQSDTSSDSLQGSLQRIFEAMERFTAESMRAYEDLLVRTEEELAPRELQEDEE